MFELSSYLPYLLNRSGSRIAESFSRMLRKKHRITLTMWRVLASLHHRNGQRVGELAQMTTIEVSTLSRLLGTMQRKGLLERRRPAVHELGGDARTVAVYVTPNGRALTEELTPEALRYEQTALAGFSLEEAEQLKSMLKRLFDNMNQLERKAPSDARLAS